METKNKNVTIKVIEAKEGYSIVRKNEDLGTAYGAKVIYLGAKDSADNYTEVEDSVLQKAHEEYEAKQKEAENDSVEDAEIVE